MNEMLNDRWHATDFPVLLEVARRIERRDGSISAHRVAEALGRDHNDVIHSLLSLAEPGGWVVGQPLRGDNQILAFMVGGLTERGRRATGLWPSEEAAADALLDLLAQAAEQVEDPDDAGVLRKASRMLKGVPSAVLSDVTAALIRQQTGL